MAAMFKSPRAVIDWLDDVRPVAHAHEDGANLQSVRAHLENIANSRSGICVGKDQAVGLSLQA